MNITIGDDLEALRAEIDRLQTQVVKLPEALARARQLYIDGDLPKPDYDVERDRLAMRKVEIEQRIRALSMEIANNDIEAAQARLETLRSVGHAMIEHGDMEPAEANQWLRTYIRIDFNADRTVTVRML